jgi:hypothetical protein
MRDQHRFRLVHRDSAGSHVTSDVHAHEWRELAHVLDLEPGPKVHFERSYLRNVVALCRNIIRVQRNHREYMVPVLMMEMHGSDLH